jgi:hypothetical protein
MHMWPWPILTALFGTFGLSNLGGCCPVWDLWFAWSRRLLPCLGPLVCLISAAAALFGTFGFPDLGGCCPVWDLWFAWSRRLLGCLAFHLFDVERTWCGLFQKKPVVCTKLYFYALFPDWLCLFLFLSKMYLNYWTFKYNQSINQSHLTHIRGIRYPRMTISRSVIG